LIVMFSILFCFVERDQFVITFLVHNYISTSEEY